MGECGPCPVLARFTLAFALQLRKKHEELRKKHEELREKHEELREKHEELRKMHEELRKKHVRTKKMERYLRVNLLGPGPRLIKKEFTGPGSYKG